MISSLYSWLASLTCMMLMAENYAKCTIGPPIVYTTRFPTDKNIEHDEMANDNDENDHNPGDIHHCWIA